MSASVLLDTSYLITLVDANRPHHAIATQYYRHLIKSDVPIYFSAIVAAEFGIRHRLRFRSSREQGDDGNQHTPKRGFMQRCHRTVKQRFVRSEQFAGACVACPRETSG